MGHSDKKKDPSHQKEDSLKGIEKAMANLDNHPQGSDDDDDVEEQAKAINEQFQMLYEKDPQLRQALGSDIEKITLEEKFTIIESYINGGGIKDLMEDDAGKDGGQMDLDEEEVKMIQEQFKAIYDHDEQL